jgi:hypothetical protein
MELQISQYIIEKYSIIKFHQNPSRWRQDVLRGRTDIQKRANITKLIFTAMLKKTQVFWMRCRVDLCICTSISKSPVASIFRVFQKGYSEYGTSKLLLNTGNCIPLNIASYPRTVLYTTPSVLHLPWLAPCGMWNFLRYTGVVNRITHYLFLSEVPRPNLFS